MAKKRQTTREEIEKDAAAELNRSMRRSLAPQQSQYSAPERSAPPSSWRQEQGPSTIPKGPGSWPTDGLSSSEEEETVTELAIQQMAERWGGQGTLEDHVMSRVNPSEAEDARDRALRQAMANQARFAKPARRTAVPQASSRGFSGTWASSPVANTSQPMVWESAMPVREQSSSHAAEEVAPSQKTPARKAAPVREVSAKKAPVRKAPAKKAPAKKAPARKAAPAKKAAPARKAPAKKAPARKAAPAKKAAPARKAPAKKAPAKKAASTRKRAAR
jgi:hypothetical protein